MKIADKTAIVTGGASGLGLAFARRLADLGASVWALDNNQEFLDSAKTDLAAESRIRLLYCDVGVEDAVKETIDHVVSETGGIDVLVNNAAILRDQTLVSRLGSKVKRHSTEDWQATLQSNLTGTFFMAREVAEKMICGSGGLIVNVSSISRAGNPGQSAYAATKAAIDALTVTWSQELAPYGVRVCAIAPGFVETNMTSSIPPLFLDQIKQRTPQKRFGTLDEFADAIQFVVENDYLNGKVLELDGGLRF